MAIVTGDGTSMVISYNKNCNYDIDTQGLKYKEGTGISSTLTSGCIPIAYDWNGGSRPNKVGEDIQVLGSAKIPGSETKTAVVVEVEDPEVEDPEVELAQ